MGLGQTYQQNISVKHKTVYTINVVVHDVFGSGQIDVSGLVNIVIVIAESV